MIARRDLGRVALGLGLLATASAATACSPDPSEPRHFDLASALIEGRWSDAEALVAPDASLIVAGLESAEILKGNSDIVARFRDLLLRDRYTFYPNRDGEKEFPIWDTVGNWNLAMLWRKNDSGLYFDESCGSRSDSFQLFVAGLPIRQLVLFQAPPTGAFRNVAIKIDSGEL